MQSGYVDTVRLLLQVLPSVFDSGLLALKGGTAINLYLDDMPRLSVDIDAVFLPLGLTREEALTAIGEEIARIRRIAEIAGLDVRQGASNNSEESQLFINNSKAQVKIEVNTVFRGSLFEPERRSLHKVPSDLFAMDVPASLLQSHEIYAGKILAALDRQHPRDLFDVWRLYQRGPINSSVLAAVVVYLCGHNRPPHEILNSQDHAIDETYRTSLLGMIRTEIPSLYVLTDVRSQLRTDILRGLDEESREFLMTFFSGTPDWALLPFMNAPNLPALRWKLMNIEKFKITKPAEFIRQNDELAKLLF